MSALFNSFTSHEVLPAAVPRKNTLEALFMVAQPLPKIPRPETRTGSPIIMMKHYLQRVIFKQAGNTVIQLPSITTLARMFEVSCDDVQAVLSEFQGMGFEYAMPNKRSPILIWDAL